MIEMAGVRRRGGRGAGRVRLGLLGMLAFGALNAFAGGYYGMSGAPGVPLEWLDGSPFSDYFVPSLILFTLVGGMFLASAVALFFRARPARSLALAAGIVVLGWLVAETLFIGYVSWMQPVTGAAGLMVLALAWFLPRPPAIHEARWQPGPAEHVAVSWLGPATTSPRMRAPWRSSLGETNSWSTLMLALLVTATSAAGLFGSGVYAGETPTWRVEAQGQDAANLLSVPVLLIAGYLASKGSRRAEMVWAGTLLFLVYAYVIYAFDVHYNRLFLLYVATLGLAVHTLLSAAWRLGPGLLARPPAESRAHRFVAGFLVVLALMFGLLWLSEDVPSALTGATPTSLLNSGLPTNPVHVLDLSFILPAAAIAGVTLWRRQPWGYVLAAPLLIFFVLTGVGIVTAMVLSTGAFPTSAMIMSAIVLVSAGLASFHLATITDRVPPALRLAA
jgi:hypothetical protein